MFFQTEDITQPVVPPKPKKNSEADVTEQQSKTSEKYEDIVTSSTVSQNEKITKGDQIQIKSDVCSKL